MPKHAQLAEDVGKTTHGGDDHEGCARDVRSYPPEADMLSVGIDVGEVPITDIASIPVMGQAEGVA